MKKNPGKINVIFFSIKMVLAIIIPGTFASFMIFIYLWFFDLRRFSKAYSSVKNTSDYAMIIAVATLVICLAIIIQRIYVSASLLFKYIDSDLTDTELKTLKKSIINIIPYLLIMTIIAWIVADAVITIGYAVNEGPSNIRLIRVFLISTLIGSSLTIIPAYFFLDTIIKNFIKKFLNDIDIQDYSDIKKISIGSKIFSIFLVGGVLPTAVIFISINDLNFLIQNGDEINAVIIGKYEVAAMSALVFSIVIPLLSALYFYFTLAKPIRQLDTTMSAIDGGNLDINLKADFTDEVGHITQGLNNMIHRVRDSVKVKEELALIEKELDIAEKVQCSVLTQPEVYENLKNYTISVLYRPQNGRVGGDYFNIMNLNDRSISVFLADATGHGMQAALTTMQIDMMNRQSLHLLDPGSRFHFLNEYYVSELKGNNLFTACCVNLYDNYVIFSGAGHPEQFLIRSDNSFELIKGTGKLIGAFQGLEYTSQKLKMEKDDTLILFTDGAFEQFNNNAEMYGEERLLRLIQDMLNNNSDLKELNKSLLKDIKSFTGKTGLNDDITVISIRKD